MAIVLSRIQDRGLILHLTFAAENRRRGREAVPFGEKEFGK
jgi:hypothetical protein